MGYSESNDDGTDRKMSSIKLIVGGGIVLAAGSSNVNPIRYAFIT